MSLLKTVVAFSMFYSIVITLLSYAVAVPSEFSAISTDLSTYSQKAETLYQSTMGIPLLDMGGLVFYTGNAVIDFIMNFLTAIPSVSTLLIDLYLRFFPLDTSLAQTFKLSVYTLASVFLIIAIVKMVLGIRTGRVEV